MALLLEVVGVVAEVVRVHSAVAADDQVVPRGAGAAQHLATLG